MNKTLLRRSPADAPSGVEEGPLLLSRLDGKAITDADGRIVGAVQDVVISMEDARDPFVRGLLVENTERGAYVSINDLAQLDPPALRVGGILEAFQRQGATTLGRCSASRLPTTHLTCLARARGVGDKPTLRLLPVVGRDP
jgi:sporulation protein YlmC with PRC-barrel domain